LITDVTAKPPPAKEALRRLSVEGNPAAVGGRGVIGSGAAAVFGSYLSPYRRGSIAGDRQFG
jgi:hypothetical protein